MKRAIALFVMLMLSVGAFAVPTVEAVQAEVGRGNYLQAENMMREVVSAKPGSAKAHYVYAEVLAHNGRFDQAVDEARLARQLDPTLKFAEAGKFTAFEQLLEREQQAARPARSQGGGGLPALIAPRAPERSGGMPAWIWGAGFALIAVVVWRMVAARRPAAPAAMPAPGWAPSAAAPMGAMTGAGPSMAGSPAFGTRSGSGMLGTGIAAAGGFAAGMLAEKLIDGHRGDAASGSSLDTNASGLVPGLFDDAPAGNPSADDLERRAIDFGSGGNDWDSGGDSNSDSGSSSSSGSDDGW